MVQFGLRVQLPNAHHPHTHPSYAILENKCLHLRYILFCSWLIVMYSDRFKRNDTPPTHKHIHVCELIHTYKNVHMCKQTNTKL